MAEDLTKKDEFTTMQRPDFMKESARGTEHITKDDVQMPRLALAQKLSPQLEETNAAYIKELKEGHLFNSVTRVNYGSGPLHFCVIRGDKPRWVEFHPREQGGGVKDPNVAPDDPRTRFGPNGEPPIATQFRDFIIMLLPSRELIALSFKSTQLKVGRELNALIKFRNADVFAGIYELTTASAENKKGKFKTFIVRNAGWHKDKATYDYAEQLFLALADKAVQIHTEREPGEDDVEFPTEEAATPGAM